MIALLSDYLARHGRASLPELSAALGSAPEAVQAMLELLVRKGRVRQVTPQTCGKQQSCNCTQVAPVIYEWLGPRK